jgi:hypothetical protein
MPLDGLFSDSGFIRGVGYLFMVAAFIRLVLLIAEPDA